MKECKPTVPPALLPVLITAVVLLGWLVASQAAAQAEPMSLERRVVSSGGDAEEFLNGSLDDSERWPAGFSYATSSDIELAYDALHGAQIVGLYFSDLEVPAGATVEEAAIGFTADADQAGEVQVSIVAQDSPSPTAFNRDRDGEASRDLSGRPISATALAWSPEPWIRDEEYQSSDISQLIQELVDHPEWKSGSGIVLLLRPSGSAGPGSRSAYSYDGDPARAPRLLLRFQEPEAGRAEPDPATAETADPAPLEAEPTAAEPERAEPADPAPIEAEPTAAEPERAEPDRGEPRQFEPAAEPGVMAPEVTEPADRQQEERETAEFAAPVPVVPEAPAPPPRPEAPLEEPQTAELAAPQSERAAQEAAVPRDPRRARYRLAANHARGVRGSVLLSDYGIGGTIVTVMLDNPAAYVSYPVSIHAGACGSGGRVVARLEPVSGGRAFASNLLPIDFDELSGNGYHVNAFRMSEEFTRVAGCATLGD